jgi:hypothetical protein
LTSISDHVKFGVLSQKTRGRPSIGMTIPPVYTVVEKLSSGQNIHMHPYQGIYILESWAGEFLAWVLFLNYLMVFRSSLDRTVSFKAIS